MFVLSALLSADNAIGAESDGKLEASCGNFISTLVLLLGIPIFFEVEMTGREGILIISMNLIDRV